jgi:hypothetical protein
MRFFRYILLYLLLAHASISGALAAADLKHGQRAEAAFPRTPESYEDAGMAAVSDKLVHRVKMEPFNAVATVLFICAITHTFLASRFMAMSHAYKHQFEELEEQENHPEERHRIARKKDKLQFRAEFFHFFGEVEAVFGIWLVPLCLSILIFHGWSTMVGYFDQVSFAEPIFVGVIMAIAASRPVLRFAEICLAKVASLGGGRPVAWWFSILTLGRCSALLSRSLQR